MRVRKIKMRQGWLSTLLILMLSLCSSSVALGQMFAPSYNNSSITWQVRKLWDQYYDNTPLELATPLVNQPPLNDTALFRISGVWVNRTYYNLWQNVPNAYVASFSTIPHGYIDDSNPSNIPRYKFMGSNWDTDQQARLAKPLIIQAFAEWASLEAVESPVTRRKLKTGLEFMLVEPSSLSPNPEAEIEIYWHQRNGLGGINRTINSSGVITKTAVYFNEAKNWWFGRASTTPSYKTHFYSSALHEIGHVVGLWEQSDWDDVMIWDRQPGPKGPAFDHLDDDSKHAVYALYSIPTPETSFRPSNLGIETGNAPLEYTGLGLSGTLGYQVSGSKVVISVERISNNSESRISGSLKLELWALASPFIGQNQRGFKLGELNLSPLNPKHLYSNISSPVEYTAPPKGSFYMALILKDWDGSNWTIRHYITFNRKENY